MRPDLRAGALATALVVAAACAPRPIPVAEPPPPPPPAAHVILDQAAIAALAELLRMEDQRVLDSVRIAGLLVHPEPQVRGRAALAAGRIGDSRAVPLMLPALSDSVTFVRASAAFALGLAADTGTAVVDALAALTRSDPADTVVVEAIGALGRLGTERSRAALLGVLDGTAPANDTAAHAAAATPGVHAALLAIWRLPRSEPAVRAVRAHVTAPDAATRWRAMYALMRLADPATIDALLTGLQDDEALVRSLAARALRAPVTDSAGTRGVVLPALVNALDDPHAHVRINAANAIATYGDSATASALAPLLTGEDTNVAIAAATALAQAGGRSASTALELVVADSAAPVALRGTALASLVRTAPERGIAAAGGLAASDDWLVRLYATRALGAAPWTVAGTLLRGLARDDDPRVAAAAIRSIATSDDTAAVLRSVAIEALGSTDVGVRAAAAAALEPRVSPADLDVLLQAYDNARLDTSNDAALAALDALAALAQQGTPVARSFFLRFQRSDDPVVRRRVARHFGTGGWGDPLPAETDRPLEFYRGVVRDLVAAELAGVPRPRALVLTAAGGITLELFGADAPLTVHNFMTLASSGYYRSAQGDGSPALRWHRVVPNFVLQDGDPRGDGSGGPGYAIRDEINRHRYGRGTLGMALSGPDTGGSQFFITHSPQPHLDGGYTVFGRVVAGMDIADLVVQDDSILSIEVFR